MPIDEIGQPALLRIRRSIRSTRTTSRRGSASSGIPTARASRSCAAATASSTTGRCWERSTTSSSTPSTPTSFMAQFPQNAADPGPRTAGFPTDPTAAMTTTVSSSRPRSARYINAQYPPGAVRRNTGTVTWDDPDASSRTSIRSAPATSARCCAGVAVSADYVRMVGRDHVPQPESQHRHPRQHEPHRTDQLHRSVRHPEREPGARVKRRTSRVVRLISRPSTATATTTR